MTDEKITQLTEATVLNDTDLDIIVQDVATIPVSKSRPLSLLRSYFNSYYQQLSGWIESTATWTFSSSDSPTFVISVNADMTAILNAGMRVRLVHSSTTKYFIVTAVGSYSGGATLITLYGGTDYTLALGTISSPYYSSAKAPFGFPVNPDKWTVEVTDSTNYTKTTPSGSTWYGQTNTMDGSTTLPTITIPIGLWTVSYKCLARCEVSAGAFVNEKVTLSTSASTESDADLSISNTINAGLSTTPNLVILLANIGYPKVISLASKTTYSLLISTANTSSITSFQVQGASSTTIIKAMCAYL